jgi:hypothetical protein
VRIDERKCGDVTSRLRFGPISVTSIPFRMTQSKKGVLPGLARRAPPLATSRDPDFSTAVRINCFSRPREKRSRRCTARALGSACCVQMLYKRSLRQRFAACRSSIRTNHLQQEAINRVAISATCVGAGDNEILLLRPHPAAVEELCQVASPKRGRFGPILFGFTTGLRK